MLLDLVKSKGSKRIAEFTKQGAEATVMKMVHKHSHLIVEQVAGCNEQCPFCKELSSHSSTS